MELSSLLNEEITPHQRFQIERELKAFKKGVAGEEDAAYYINFHFEASKNWAVVHDLRIEYEGQVAQIDHILMNRTFDVYLLETKNYSYKIMITPEGEFKIYSGKQYYGVPSPIEQNRRHIHLLERFLKANDILPKRMGIAISPRIKSLILISPKSIISRPPEKKFDTSMVIKADTLRSKIDEEVEKIGPVAAISSITKACSSSTLEEVAKRLVGYHRQHKTDWRGRFGISDDGFGIRGNAPAHENAGVKINHPPAYYCFKCEKRISEKVTGFCLQNNARFGGKVYCFKCQKYFP